MLHRHEAFFWLNVSRSEILQKAMGLDAPELFIWASFPQENAKIERGSMPPRF